MRLGKGFKLGRALVGMTQSRLAEGLGVKASYVSLIEKNKKQGSGEMWRLAPQVLGLSPNVFLLLCSGPEDHHSVSAFESRRLAEILFVAITGYGGPVDPDTLADYFPEPAPTTLIRLPGTDALELWDLKRRYLEGLEQLESLGRVTDEVDALLDTAGESKRHRSDDDRVEALAVLDEFHVQYADEAEGPALVRRLLKVYEGHPHLEPLLSSVRELIVDGTVSHRVLHQIFGPYLKEAVGASLAEPLAGSSKE